MNNSNDKRQQWGSKMGFILSAIGSAVGLGNIWRFPYVLYTNGGGTFLIPYFVAIFTAAIPLLILEYVVGSRFRGAAPLAMARIKKGFEWIGWLPTLVAGFIVIYYSAILSWAINYFFLSFNKGWTDTPGDFFFGEFLKASSGPTEIGGINVTVLISIFIIWAGSYILCSRRVDKGIEAINKVLLPLMFVIMMAIVIRGVTLTNAAAGLNALFTPDWSRLLDAKVWVAAYGQVFFSTSLAMGIMVTYSSYLPKNTEIVNSAFLSALANSMFEFTVSIGVFGILGFMAYVQGVPVTEVVKSGIGLAFIAFPTGINEMGQFGFIVGILFFSCLTFAGFTSFISLLEAFCAPFIEKLGVSRKKMFSITCFGGFIASILFCTGAGLYILDIADFFLNNFGLVSVGILETVALGWVMKIGNFREMANKNSYFKVGKWWEVCIKIILPVLLIVSLALTTMNLLSNGYENYSVYALSIYGGSIIVFCFAASYLLTKIKWSTKLDLNDEE